MNPLMAAFLKLLAPRPVLYLFPDLRGWWYAASEDPETFQVIIGISMDLYYDLRDEIMKRSGRNIEDLCDVVMAEGARYQIERPARPGLWLGPMYRREIVIDLKPAPVPRP